jgi:hypothetical protein
MRWCEKKQVFAKKMADPVEEKETRNQRRTRRRAETRENREAERKEELTVRVAELCASARATLVFLFWETQCAHGYAYGHSQFANGTRVRTSPVHRNTFVNDELWFIATANTNWRVVRHSDAWHAVGAGNARNRLCYKLWPKLVLLGMYRRIRYNPGNSAYLLIEQEYNSTAAMMSDMNRCMHHAT